MKEVKSMSPASWKGVCIDCATRTNLQEHEFTLKYLPKRAYLGLIVNILTFLIARSALKKALKIEADICGKCSVKHNLWKKIGLISIIILPVNFIIGFNLEAPNLLFFNSITLTTIVLSLISYHKIKHGLSVSGLKDGEFTVQGFSKNIVKRIERKMFP